MTPLLLAGQSGGIPISISSLSLDCEASPDIEHITLQIGEGAFQTTVFTLSGNSTYFASLFSGRWNIGCDHDGSLFIDADPKAFEHLLRYMRTGVMPLFWSQAGGFDLGLYNSVLASADYFGVEKLVSWIKEKKFFNAVNFEYTLVAVRSALFFFIPRRQREMWNMNMIQSGALLRSISVQEQFQCTRELVNFVVGNAQMRRLVILGSSKRSLSSLR